MQAIASAIISDTWLVESEPVRNRIVPRPRPSRCDAAPPCRTHNCRSKIRCGLTSPVGQARCDNKVGRLECPSLAPNARATLLSHNFIVESPILVVGRKRHQCRPTIEFVSFAGEEPYRSDNKDCVWNAVFDLKRRAAPVGHKLYCRDTTLLSDDNQQQPPRTKS